MARVRDFFDVPEVKDTSCHSYVDWGRRFFRKSTFWCGTFDKKYKDDADVLSLYKTCFRLLKQEPIRVEYVTSEGSQTAFLLDFSSDSRKTPPEKVWVMMNGINGLALYFVTLLARVEREHLSELAFLMIEHPGYGEWCSGGPPTEFSSFESTSTALATAGKMMGLGGSELAHRLNFIGYSAGASSILWYTSKMGSYGSVILISPFVRAENAVNNVISTALGGSGFLSSALTRLVSPDIDNGELIDQTLRRSVERGLCKIVVIHGVRDEICNFMDSLIMSRRMINDWTGFKFKFVQCDEATHETVLTAYASTVLSEMGINVQIKNAD